MHEVCINFVIDHCLALSKDKLEFYVYSLETGWYQLVVVVVCCAFGNVRDTIVPRTSWLRHV